MLLQASKAADWQSEGVLPAIQVCAVQACKIPSLFEIFLSWHLPSARQWKYDKDISEFFVQTSDKVKLKRSELERWMKAQDATDEVQQF